MRTPRTPAIAPIRHASIPVPRSNANGSGLAFIDGQPESRVWLICSQTKRNDMPQQNAMLRGSASARAVDGPGAGVIRAGEVMSDEVMLDASALAGQRAPMQSKSIY